MAKRVNSFIPRIEQIFGGHAYKWIIEGSEYASDVLFISADHLQSFYTTLWNKPHFVRWGIIYIHSLAESYMVTAREKLSPTESIFGAKGFGSNLHLIKISSKCMIKQVFYELKPPLTMPMHLKSVIPIQRALKNGCR